MNYYYYYDELYYNNVNTPTNTKVIVYVGDLPPYVDQFELNKFILSKGEFNIDSIFVQEYHGQSFAYVKFKTQNDADKAIKALHLQNFKDYIIKAEPFKYNHQIDKTNTEGNVIIHNLPFDTTPKDLYEMFIAFGNIVSVNLKKDFNGNNTGVGFVNFAKAENAVDAVDKMNQAKLKGNVLNVGLSAYNNKRNDNNNKDEYSCDKMLVVNKIPKDIENDEQLQKVFECYGKVVVCGVVKEGLEGSERKGVVVYEKREETEKAFNAFSNNNKLFEVTMTPIDNEMITKVKMDLCDDNNKNNKNRNEGVKLVVKNIPQCIGEKELRDVFRRYGDVVSVGIHNESEMKETKDENGNVVKDIVNVSTGCGYVVFKTINEALKAQRALHNKYNEYKGVGMKLQIENYNNNKPYKTTTHNEIRYHKYQQQPFKYQYNYNRYNNKKNKFNNRINAHQHHMHYASSSNNNKYSAVPNNQVHSTMPMNIIPITNSQQQTSYINANQLSHGGSDSVERVTVEGEGLVEKVKEILQIENINDRTEALGEVLFYFLMKFIPQYKLNMTEGKCSDTTINSKLTGILIRTNPNNLLEIISTTTRFENSLRDILLKLIQANRLDI